MFDITDGLIRRYLHKRNNRNTIGWIDFSRGSWDWRTTVARLYRIQQRCRGRRLSFNEAFREVD